MTDILRSLWNNGTVADYNTNNNKTSEKLNENKKKNWLDRTELA